MLLGAGLTPVRVTLHDTEAGAWKMIEAPTGNGRIFELCQFLSERPEEFPDLDFRLAKRAADGDWTGRWGLFDYWRNRNRELPEAAWRTLTQADCVWTRLHLCDFFAAV
jgi:hypothetical protein